MSYVRSRHPVGEFSLSTLNPFRKFPLPPKPEPGTPDEGVALLRRIEAQHDRFVSNDERARWLQLAATLSVPLASVVWRWILGRRKGIDQ